MRETLRKFSRVLIPLALVAAALALVLGLSMMLVSADNGAIGIEILEPKPEEHVLKNQTFDVQVVFTATKDVPDVYPSLEIAPAGSAVIVEGPDPAVPLNPHDNQEGKKAAWWKLHCTQEGTTTITVVGMSKVTGASARKSVTVLQQPSHPKLRTKIVKPTHLQAYVSQQFSVEAVIENFGGEPAMDVEATIELNGGTAELVEGECDTKQLGEIPPGESHTVLWTVHCTDVGDAIITVTPRGRDDVSGDWIAHVESATIVVKQVARQEIDVEIVEPLDKQVICHHEVFWVTALVKNTGYSALSDIDVVLGWDPRTALGALFQEYTQTIPYLAKDDAVEVTWKVQCTDAGPDEVGYLWTTITVKATGTSELCDCEVSDSDSIEVKQKYVTVEIVDPVDGHWFKQGTGFTIDFEVVSCGDYLNTALAKLTVGPGLSIVGLDQVPLGNLVEDRVYLFEDKFSVKCVDGTHPGTYTVTVNGVAYGGKDRWNHDTGTVNQFRDDPQLLVTIDDPQSSTWYNPSDVFTVKATVAAAGGGFRPPVWSPVVTLTVDGKAEILTAPVIRLGALDPGKSVEVTWQVHCTGPCDVDISVEATGVNPQCGKGYKVGPATDSITVHQFPLKATIVQFPNEVESGATFGIHAQVAFEEGACEACGYDCEDCGISDVWGTIEIIEGPATLEGIGETATKEVGTVLCPEGLAQDVEWTVKCTAPGTVKIRVKAWTKTNPETGQPLDKELRVWSDFVAIRQLPRLVGYEVQLCKHWNYMSLPLIPPAGATLADVLNSVEASTVDIWAYDAANDQWLTYAPGKGQAYYDQLALQGIGQLTGMEDGEGYIIRLMWPEIFEYEGYDWPAPDAGIEPPVYDLYQGWQLVGVTTLGDNSLAAMDAEHYLASLNDGAGGLDPDVIVGDEARMLRTYLCGYPGHWSELDDDLDQMEPYQAYWLYASLPDLKIVPPLQD